MKKVYYIAGKISGESNYEEKFAKAEAEIIKMGGVALNPAIIPEGLDKKKYLPICLDMIDCADCVYMLSNWRESGGAKIEHEYGVYQGKEIIYEEEAEHGNQKAD